jgi:hypothetical protein
MLNMFILIYSGGRGVKFMKHLKGRESYKSLNFELVLKRNSENKPLGCL